MNVICWDQLIFDEWCDHNFSRYWSMSCSTTCAVSVPHCPAHVRTGSGHGRSDSRLQYYLFQIQWEIILNLAINIDKKNFLCSIYTNHSIFTLCIFILCNRLFFFFQIISYALFHVYFAFTIKCILWNNQIKIIYGFYKDEFYCGSVKWGKCKLVYCILG